MTTGNPAHHGPEVSPAIDLSKPFIPEALAGAMPAVLDPSLRRLLNPIRAASYLHLFDLFESAIANAVRLAMARAPTESSLATLLHPGAFDHADLFRRFEHDLASTFPGPLGRIPRPVDLDAALDLTVPLGLVVFALHMKLVTQQHYLACVRGDERLEPSFVDVLKRHWDVECRGPLRSAEVGQLQEALSRAPQDDVPRALNDYRRLVFICDDVIGRQASLDVVSLESARGGRLPVEDRRSVHVAQVGAHRKAFLTVGIVNAAFVYAMRALGPTAPSMLAGIVAALSSR